MANLIQQSFIESGLIKRVFIPSTLLGALLVSVIGTAGCKVEVLPTREQQKQAEEERKGPKGPGSVTVLPTPTTDNAAAVIASCGPATSDEVVRVNDKLDSGKVRRMVYRRNREVTLDFLPLQTNASSGQSATSSNTVWRFDVALVDDQKLLTASNIRVYLPCAANALAKEF